MQLDAYKQTQLIIEADLAWFVALLPFLQELSSEKLASFCQEMEASDHQGRMRIVDNMRAEWNAFCEDANEREMFRVSAECGAMELEDTLSLIAQSPLEKLLALGNDLPYRRSGGPTLSAVWKEDPQLICQRAAESMRGQQRVIKAWCVAMSALEASMYLII